MDNPKTNIAEQITSGFINIDSVEEFREILKDFPEDPALHKAYADLLLKKNCYDLASLSYGRVAALYLKSGNLLPAVVAKLLQWRVKSAHYQDAQLFLSALGETSIPETPFKVFFERLSKPEMFAVMKCLKNIQLPQGQLVQKCDEPEQHLYFIVSGSIKETSYQPVKKGEETFYKQSVAYLSDDDTFGEIYPLKRENICQSFIETLVPVELVKISKETLLQVYKKYPNVEAGLHAVSIFRSEFRKKKLLKKNRKSQRHAIIRKMSLEIFPHASANYPFILEAYSRDLSVDGTCLVLDAGDISIAKSIASFSETIKDSKVNISLPCEGMELKVSGKIAWTQEIIFKGEKTLAVGIQFQNLSPKLRGMLFVFADSSRDN